MPVESGREVVVEESSNQEADVPDEESLRTTPVTGNIDANTVKSPYENNFQEKTAPDNEFSRVVFMFLKVMFAVAICSLIIYVLLLLVKKFYGVPKTSENKDVEDNLKSTQSENEALKIFFNKTKGP